MNIDSIVLWISIPCASVCVCVWVSIEILKLLSNPIHSLTNKTRQSLKIIHYLSVGYVFAFPQSQFRSTAVWSPTVSIFSMKDIHGFWYCWDIRSRFNNVQNKQKIKKG